VKKIEMKIPKRKEKCLRNLLKFNCSIIILYKKRKEKEETMYKNEGKKPFQITNL